MTTLLWLRRDLRRHDHPALTAASRTGPVLPVFVIDPVVWQSCGPVRRAWIAATVEATRTAYDDMLCVRVGRASQVIPELAAEVGAGAVHVTAESTPWGRRRDERVRSRLAEAGIDWVATGTPYAVPPGTVHTQTGDPYQVFTPFARTWRQHLPDHADPATDPPRWEHAADDPRATELLRTAVDECPIRLPEAGEQGALRRWHTFLRDGLAGYGDGRDRPDLPGTSQLSPWLKVGAIHPRVLLADLAEQAGDGADRYTDELAWREFYADVLHHHPRSAWQDLRRSLHALEYDQPADAIEAWRSGHTGYPIVDAGMRQLVATGWMHNRVRMLTASFLTKDSTLR